MVKVTLRHGSSTVDTDISQDMSVAAAVEAAVAALEMPPGDWVLFLDESQAYVRDATQIKSLSKNTKLTVKCEPRVEAAKVLEALGESSKCKMALFQLSKTHLKDAEFLQHFVAAGGGGVLMEVICTSSGSSLAYALSALNVTLKHSSSPEAPEDAFVSSLAQSLLKPSINVQKGVMGVITTYVTLNLLSRDKLEECMRKAVVEVGHADFDEDCDPLLPFVSLMAKSGDSDVRMSVLQLLVELANKEDAPMAFLARLDGLGLRDAADELFEVELIASWKETMYRYQRVRMYYLTSEYGVPYDTENEAHVALLSQLWSSLHPDQAVPPVPDPLWKTVGFQGEDPATDFRGMGVVGLRHLVYFAGRYASVMKELLTLRSGKDVDHYYPVAATGINMSRVLFQEFALDRADDEDRQVHQMLTEPNALEEMYVSMMSYLEHTFARMNATYMDFQQVLQRVLEAMRAVLERKPKFVADFKAMIEGAKSSSGSGAASVGQATSSIGSVNINISRDEYGLLVTHLRKHMLELIGATKVDCVLEGAFFHSVVEHGKGRVSVSDDFYFVRVTKNLSELQWAVCATDTVVPAVLPESVALNAHTDVAYGAQCPIWQRQRKAEESVVDLCFAMLPVGSSHLNPTLVSSTYGAPSSSAAPGGPVFEVTLKAADTGQLVDWVDGLKALLGRPLELSEQANDDLKTLVETELIVRSLDLNQLSFPKDPPEVPPPPTTFDFANDQ